MQLSTCYLFQGLSECQLKQLIAISTEIRVQQGTWLYHENEPADQMFVLKDGAVELLSTIDDAIELPITIIRSPGSCFGTSALIPPHLYSLSARCAKDATLQAIKQNDLRNLIQQNGELGFAILTNLAKHFLDRLKETRQELKIHFKTLFKSMHH
ncbi:MAG: cyclic nucleotide-binding domain-containing protein [Desulfobacterales bacterium]|nr:MAG: cyclic nucleotide-binding domain-containing protein [Desulfobacterales bacterium]